MDEIKVGIIGMGLIGVSHVEAVRRIGCAELVAVTDSNIELAQKKTREFNLPKCYDTVDDLLNDSEIRVVHNCTPNNLHLEVNEKIIKAGKHVFSEKPLAMNKGESRKLLDLLAGYPQTVHGVNFNYRMNPLLQEMKHRISEGEIGKPVLVHGSYLQDWLLYDTDYNWRIEPEIGGPSRCVADIGSHWIDCVQSVTGGKIVEVCADLVTTIPIRKKPKSQVETFSINNNIEYEEKKITTEDYGAVLFKMDNGVSGTFHVSQVSAGRKCFLNFEIDGTRASYYWNQESADQMWMGFRDQNNHQIIRNPNLMTPQARKFTYLPAGHPEGWNDAFKNNIQSFYQFVLSGKRIGEGECDFSTFEDGHYVMKVVDAIVKSGKERRWVWVEE